MRANTVPTTRHGFKPFPALIGAIGVNSPSGRFCRRFTTHPSGAALGVRVRHVSSAALMAGQTLTTAELTERGQPSLKVGKRRSGERRGARLDPRRMNQRNQPTRPRSVSPAEDTA